MEKELDYLGGALEQPQRPFVAILGGSKISGKIDVIEALLPKVDRAAHRRRDGVHLLQGDGARDGQVARRSRSRRDGGGAARDARAPQLDAARTTRSVAPGDRRRRKAHARCSATQIPADEAMFDIGPRTARVVRARDREREDGALERTDGRVRDAAVRHGHARDRRRDGEGDGAGRDDDRRRRRFGGRGGRSSASRRR